MAKKNEYDYFAMKAAAEKKSRGPFILPLPPKEEEDGSFTDRKIVVEPFTVKKGIQGEPWSGSERAVEIRIRRRAVGNAA